MRIDLLASKDDGITPAILLTADGANRSQVSAAVRLLLSGTRLLMRLKILAIQQRLK